jgi:hypothetical protein
MAQIVAKPVVEVKKNAYGRDHVLCQALLSG